MQVMIAPLRALPSELLERRDVEQFDGATLSLDQPLLLEAREQPAHRLEFESKEAAYFLACHPQHELGGGIAALSIAMRKIEQERRQSLLGAHAAEQEHDVVIAIDFARKKAMQVVLQRRNVTCQFLQALERNRADLTVLKRD